MSEEKKAALDVLKEIAQDTQVEAHVRVNAAAMLLSADTQPTAPVDEGGIPIEPGKTDEPPTEPSE